MITKNLSTCKPASTKLSNPVDIGSGNLIPHSWYSKITTNGGKADTIAIYLLAELWSLYRSTGQEEHQKDYCFFSKKFHLSTYQIREAFVRLEALNLMYRRIGTQVVQGRKCQIYDDLVEGLSHEELRKINKVNFKIRTEIIIMIKKENIIDKSVNQKGRAALPILENGLAKSFLFGVAAVSLGMVLPEFALATSKFDINAGVTAATDPLINGLKAHWGKGVLLAGGASALIGEGDLRQKAIKAAIGCGVSGGVVLALIAMLS